MSLRLLQHISTTLKTNQPIESEWFRKCGPIAADFDDDKVYRRTDYLRLLENLVQQGQMTLLSGKTGSGKTVLVRQLVYETYKGLETDVYFFNCDLHRNFNYSVLLHEICEVTGLVIIEDAHLETHKIQILCSELRDKTDVHILIVARPSYKETAYGHGSSLEELPSLLLDSPIDIEQIIGHFAWHNPDLPWTPQVVTSLISISSPDLWLLSCALLGYKASHTIEASASWIMCGVQEHLSRLDSFHPFSPHVLIALSPLYMYETFTAELFLTQALKIDPSTLAWMLERGEIIRQIDSDGNILYGLPHSTLASAYWKYGDPYKMGMNLTTPEDYIYEYLLYHAPNSMEALQKCDYHFQLLVYNNLCQENPEVRLAIVEHERSLRSLSTWVENGLPLNTSCLQELAERISYSKDIVSISDLVNSIFHQDKHAGYHLWIQLDHDNLNQLLRSNPCLADQCNAVAYYRFDETIQQSMEEVLDQRLLATRISRIVSFSQAADGLRSLHRFSSNNSFVEIICELIDVPALAERMNSSSDVLGIARLLGMVNIIDRNKGDLLWQSLDQKRLAMSICTHDCAVYIGICLAHLNKVDLCYSQTLCRYFDLRYPAEILQATTLDKLTHCMKEMRKCDADTGKNFVRLLDLKFIAKQWHKTSHVTCFCDFLEEIAHHDEGQFWAIWSILDKNFLMEKIDLLGDAYRECSCIISIRRALGNNSDQFYPLLDLNRWAQRINHGEIELEHFLFNIFINTTLCDKFCCLLDFTKLGEVYSKSDVYNICCIEHLHRELPNVAAQIVTNLDLEEVAQRLNESEEEDKLMECVMTITKVNKVAGHVLRNLLVNFGRWPDK
ncbi:hypothetical protein ACFL3F_03135 [Planctomycetota bacterium]